MFIINLITRDLSRSCVLYAITDETNAFIYFQLIEAQPWHMASDIFVTIGSGNSLLHKANTWNNDDYLDQQ